MGQNNVKRSRVRIETARLQRVRVTEGVSTGARVRDRELIASSKPVEGNYSCCGSTCVGLHVHKVHSLYLADRRTMHHDGDGANAVHQWQCVGDVI